MSSIKTPAQKTGNFWRYAILSYVFFIVVFVAYVIIKANQNLYPNFSGDAIAALAASFAMFSIPWWLITLGVWSFKYKKHWGIKAATVVLGVLSLVVGLYMGTVLMTLNLASYTTDNANYLKFDEGITMSQKAQEMFPKEIPQTAERAQYYYSACLGVDNMTLIQLELVLPAAEFAEEVDRLTTVMADAQKQTSADNENLPPEEQFSDTETFLLLGSSLAVLYDTETRRIFYAYGGDEM